MDSPSDDSSHSTSSQQSDVTFDSLLSAIVFSADDAIITTNQFGIIETFNRAAAEMFGYDADEMVGKNINFLMPEPAHSKHDAYLEQFRKTGERKIIGARQQVEVRKKNGDFLPIELIVNVVEHPTEPKFVGIIHDISKQTELEGYRSLLSSVVESSADAIIAKDLNGIITFWNRGAERIYGYTAEEVRGKSINVIVPEESRPELARLNESIKSGQQRVQLDTVCLHKNGSLIDISVSISPIHGRKGELIGTSSIGRDISDRLQAERNIRRYAEQVETAREVVERQAEALGHQAEQLRLSREEAESANHAKSEFLANMSHEIRTPMTAILGFAEIVEQRLIDAESLDAIRTVRRNGEYLLQVINDILDLSKIEAGKMTVEHIPCDLITVLNEVVSLMEVRATSKGLPLKLEFASLVPRLLVTDPTRLRQILINLLSNALKFTEVGSVTVRVHVESDPSPHIRFEVIDTGIGMSQDQLERLYSPFTQADCSTARRFGGTGLGLTISKRLVEMLGGEIKVQSESKKGTIFRFDLPLGERELSQMIDPSPASRDKQRTPKETRTNYPVVMPENCRILLAEDGPDNQRLISFILRKAKVNVTIAENGERAVELLRQSVAENEPFDVTIMDMQMPVLDGYNATRELRRLKWRRPVIALTALAMQGDAKKCLEAGCDDYLTKPVDKQLLIETVALHASVARRIKPTLEDSTNEVNFSI
ncbi:PAS domain-containing hybrid sensor histidine kinase/response regulator [Calycomorphotria hydatis]|uniref:Sensor protein FixL n=1 Tax=Calycomorphotria hydatis TaxID=2528027 RepID=A0A517TBG3_9PLAN|nr:PAS domain S-box protein [Calycomorphotria hydatis]QDT65711.1 Autoinducer 2 sensor kinase/phosphatase LuxQ [Calycomorphotria hydatis]